MESGTFLAILASGPGRAVLFDGLGLGVFGGLRETPVPVIPLAPVARVT